MEDPLAAIRATFFQECEEQLAELESGLIAMESGVADTETVNAVFRAVHSMKGGAGIFALDTLVRFAHIFETALDGVRSGTLDATPRVMAVFLRAADLLADLVRAARENKPGDEVRIAALGLEFDQINGSNSDAANTAQNAPSKPNASIQNDEITEWNISFSPYSSLYANANETALILREINRLGKVQITLDDSQLPELQDFDPEGAYLSWNIILHSDCSRQDIVNLFEFIEGDCRLDITPIEPEGFEPGAVIIGDNGFKFEFFSPLEEVITEDSETVYSNE